jgi:hypothetical protein
MELNVKQAQEAQRVILGEGKPADFPRSIISSSRLHAGYLSIGVPNLSIRQRWMMYLRLTADQNRKLICA